MGQNENEKRNNEVVKQTISWTEKAESLDVEWKNKLTWV